MTICSTVSTLTSCHCANAGAMLKKTIVCQLTSTIGDGMGCKLSEHMPNLNTKPGQVLITSSPWIQLGFVGACVVVDRIRNAVRRWRSTHCRIVSCARRRHIRGVCVPPRLTPTSPCREAIGYAITSSTVPSPGNSARTLAPCSTKIVPVQDPVVIA